MRGSNRTSWGFCREGGQRGRGQADRQVHRGEPEGEFLNESMSQVSLKRRLHLATDVCGVRVCRPGDTAVP